jgi:hypothetical protein
MFRATRRLQAIFEFNRERAFRSLPRDLRQLEAWRANAGAVWARWDVLLASPPERGAGAFAAYIGALDAEAAAAEEMESSMSARV